MALRSGLESDRWHPLPAPLAWRERVLTLGTRRVVEDVLDLDDVEVAGRKWVHVSATKTRRRLAALARQLDELQGATFGPTPHRVTVVERSVDEVSFRCLMPAERGGGSLDRMWSFAHGSLVGVGLRSAVVPDVDLTARALDRAVRVLVEWVAA
ncbi:MAG: hypothetical protein ACRDWI_11690 [Jiangellaceae bacterium]